MTILMFDYCRKVKSLLAICSLRSDKTRWDKEMNNDIKDFKYMNKEFCRDIKEILEQARKRVYHNIQSEMVLAY